MLRRSLTRSCHLLLVVALIFVAACPQMPGGNGGGGGGGGGGDGFERGFGATPNTPEFVAARPQTINPFAASASAQLPPAADLTRDVPNIGDQGMLGSCTAWATGYAAASYTANRQFAWGNDGLSSSEIASPGYLYERLLETDNFSCGDGTFITTALDLLVADGCSSFALVDYSDQVCTNGSPNDDAANFRIGSYNRVTENDLNALRGELARGSILVIGARLDDDFQSYTGSPEVYRGSGTPLLSGSLHAAHAMAAVGYDDSRQAFRIMNSWSTLWGDSGFMWMHYDTFKRTVFEVYALEPTSDRMPVDPNDGGGNGGELAIELRDAFQFADIEQGANGPQPVIYLVFYLRSNQPVLLNTYRISGPDGATGEFDYANQFMDGYIHAVSNTRFTPGRYNLELDVTIQDGTSNTILISEVQIGDIGGGGGGGGLCSDSCIFAYDGECDDGGPNADFALCDLGSDCRDCGARDENDGGADGLCTDSCRFAGDGECDDGGPGADFAVCALGTDCLDCGIRDRSGGGELCENYCNFAFDGECDDGGAGADFAVCDFGSDCDDCGPRSADDFGDLQGCEDTCPFAGDGECDDGGPGAQFFVCDFGTDCLDCGPRAGDGGVCEDTCEFAFDFECDDGGPGASFAVCEFGTDCFDCGVRDGSGGGGGGDFDLVCEDFCDFSFDGFCDDGGPGAFSFACDFGTDCGDCGPRDFSDFKTAARNAKSAPKAQLMRTAKLSKALTPKDDATTARSVEPARFFRGLKIETPNEAKGLPAKSMHEGVRGANRKPARLVSPQRK